MKNVSAVLDYLEMNHYDMYETVMEVEDEFESLYLVKLDEYDEDQIDEFFEGGYDDDIEAVMCSKMIIFDREDKKKEDDYDTLENIYHSISDRVFDKVLERKVYNHLKKIYDNITNEDIDDYNFEAGFDWALEVKYLHREEISEEEHVELRDKLYAILENNEEA